MFSKAFGFIRINSNFVSEKTGKFSKTADISTTCSGLLGGVDAGVKGETFYQLCKHSTSCLLLGVMKLGTSVNLLALSPRAQDPCIERLTRPVRPHYFHVRFEKWDGSLMSQREVFTLLRKSRR